MPRIVDTTPELFEYWNNIADQADPEAVPADLRDVGGFEYLVAPQEAVGGRYFFGGYDITDTETGEITSRIVVGDELPRHVRGLLVAHLVMHKSLHDDGAPQLCGRLDRSIQSVLAEGEPSLIIPFYDESKNMYRTGLDFYKGNKDTPRLIIARYARAFDNSASKGRKARASEERLLMLDEAGLELPSDDVALVGIDKRSGLRTRIMLQTEKGNKHKCRECSQPIVKNEQRVTTLAGKEYQGRDHHHYHPGCFKHLELGTFTDLRQA